MKVTQLTILHELSHISGLFTPLSWYGWSIQPAGPTSIMMTVFHKTNMIHMQFWKNDVSWCFTYWCLVGNWWEWGNGMVIDSYCGSVPHSLLRTSKFMISHDFPATYGDPFWRWRILWSPMVKSPSASLTGTTWTSEWFSSPASSTQKSKKKSPKGIPSGNLT